MDVVHRRACTGDVLARAPARNVDTWVWLGDVPIAEPKPQPMTEYEQTLARSRVFASHVDDSEQHVRRNRFLEKKKTALTTTIK